MNNEIPITDASPFVTGLNDYAHKDDNKREDKSLRDYGEKVFECTFSNKDDYVSGTLIKYRRDKRSIPVWKQGYKHYKLEHNEKVITISLQVARETNGYITLESRGNKNKKSSRRNSGRVRSTTADLYAIALIGDASSVSRIILVPTKKVIALVGKIHDNLDKKEESKWTHNREDCINHQSLYYKRERNGTNSRILLPVSVTDLESIALGDLNDLSINEIFNSSYIQNKKEKPMSGKITQNVISILRKEPLASQLKTGIMNSDLYDYIDKHCDNIKRTSIQGVISKLKATGYLKYEKIQGNKNQIFSLPKLHINNIDHISREANNHYPNGNQIKKRKTKQTVVREKSADNTTEVSNKTEKAEVTVLLAKFLMPNGNEIEIYDPSVLKLLCN